MRVVCAWCRTQLSDKAPVSNTTITHGICAPCLKKQFELLDQLRETQQEAICQRPKS